MIGGLKNTSIQRKLMGVILITCGATLLITCLGYFGFEFFNFRKTYLGQLSNTAKIIASNSTAALAFDNPKDASEILHSLKADPHIIEACLYTMDGKIFARYPLNRPTGDFPQKPGFAGFKNDIPYFEGFQPVIQGNMQLGTLYLKTDMKAMYQLFEFFGLIVLAVFGFSFLFAYLLSERLQGVISNPILALAQISKTISQNHDYSVRATKFTNDELGLLTDTFNQMLAQIEAQNAEIVSLNQNLEQKINQRTTQLEAANRELEAFTFSVSHDLRAPLRAVNGFTTILEEDYTDALDNDGKALLKQVRKNATKMGALIDDLLDFSKLGKKEISKSLVDMNDLVTNILTDISKSTPYLAQIKVHPLGRAMADASLMTQVITNLLSNAIKYSSKKKNPVVEIKLNKVDGELIYSVSDNGAGFDMKYANKLFGVFQRLHTEEEFEGTGVGLAIVERIIAKHGGRVWAEGKEGEGATFYFSLPNVNNIKKPNTL